MPNSYTFINGDSDRSGRPLSRRAVLNRLLLTSGAAAVATMTMHRTPASAATTAPTPEPTPPAGPPLGPPVRYADFVGVTTDGTPLPDLYEPRHTGVSTVPVMRAGAAFLAALTPEQRAETWYDVTADQWLNWSNVDYFPRRGVRLRDLTDTQRRAGLGLLRAGLSARGLRTCDTIRRLNHIAGRLLGDLDRFDDDLYHFTVMGTPSATEPWGWQFQGHHLVVNYFVLGDQVVMSPTFLGSEPRFAYDEDGTTIDLFAREITGGLAMVHSLTPAQRGTAVVSAVKNSYDGRAGAFQDNVVLPYTGIAGRDLTDAQRRRLFHLIGLFVGNLDDGHARVQMDAVRQHLADTHFAWIGATTADAVFYFRVHSPVILIEFDCQGTGPASGAVPYAADPAYRTAVGVAPAWQPPTGPPPAGTPGVVPASRDHIHCVVRTPNGNDYGFDLLADHLANHPHHAR
jgi:hypothetical protein